MYKKALLVVVLLPFLFSCVTTISLHKPNKEGLTVYDKLLRPRELGKEVSRNHWPSEYTEPSESGRFYRLYEFEDGSFVSELTDPKYSYKKYRYLKDKSFVDYFFHALHPDGPFLNDLKDENRNFNFGQRNLDDEREYLTGYLNSIGFQLLFSYIDTGGDLENFIDLSGIRITLEAYKSDRSYILHGGEPDWYNKTHFAITDIEVRVPSLEEIDPYTQLQRDYSQENWNELATEFIIMKSNERRGSEEERIIAWEKDVIRRKLYLADRRAVLAQHDRELKVETQKALDKQYDEAVHAQIASILSNTPSSSSSSSSSSASVLALK